MNESIVSGLLTSLGSSALVGFLFWNYFKATISFLKEQIESLKLEQAKFLTKETYRESEKRIEEKIEELKERINEMPDAIGDILKSILRDGKS